MAGGTSYKYLHVFLLAVGMARGFKLNEEFVDPQGMTFSWLDPPRDEMGSSYDTQVWRNDSSYAEDEGCCFVAALSTRQEYLHLPSLAPAQPDQQDMASSEMHDGEGGQKTGSKTRGKRRARHGPGYLARLCSVGSRQEGSGLRDRDWDGAAQQ